VGDKVKCGNGFGNVKGLGVGNRGDRDQADVTGRGGNPGGHQNGVGPARQPTWFDVRTASALRGECVVERDEVQQAAFGGHGHAGPVPAAGDRFGAGRVPPSLRMPAVPVERDAEMQVIGHGAVSSKVFTNATGKPLPSPDSGSVSREYPAARYSASASGWRSPVVRYTRR
jgi:hypothetical protein